MDAVGYKAILTAMGILFAIYHAYGEKAAYVETKPASTQQISPTQSSIRRGEKVVNENLSSFHIEYDRMSAVSELEYYGRLEDCATYLKLKDSDDYSSMPIDQVVAIKSNWESMGVKICPKSLNPVDIERSSEYMRSMSATGQPISKIFQMTRQLQRGTLELSELQDNFGLIQKYSYSGNRRAMILLAYWHEQFGSEDERRRIPLIKYAIQAHWHDEDQFLLGFRENLPGLTYSLSDLEVQGFYRSCCSNVDKNYSDLQRHYLVEN